MMPAREACRTTGMLPEYRIALFLAMLYTRHGFSKTRHAGIAWESNDMSFGQKHLKLMSGGILGVIPYHAALMTFRF